MKLIAKILMVNILISGTAYATGNDYNHISFTSEVKSEIDNDEIRANMSKTTQSATAAGIAQELNQTINQALKIAKKYPDVIVKTGRQNTYPRYDYKNGNQIIGFSGSVSLDLRSNNFTQASQLIADLQSTMVLNNLHFGVSQDAYANEENRIKTLAIERFQQDAQNITQAFKANDYKIVSVQLSGSSPYYYSRPIAMTTSLKSMDAGIEAQNFQGGKTTLSYSANGVIKLVK